MTKGAEMERHEKWGLIARWTVLFWGFWVAIEMTGDFFGSIIACMLIWAMVLHFWDKLIGAWEHGKIRRNH